MEDHSSGCGEGWGALAQTHCLSLVYQVLPDGTYIKLGTAKSNYLSMVVVRVDILSDEVIPLLQKACVIAIRYSVIRRQSRLRPRQGAPRGATAARATSIPQCLPPDTNPPPEWGAGSTRYPPLHTHSPGPGPSGLWGLYLAVSNLG